MKNNNNNEESELFSHIVPKSNCIGIDNRCCKISNEFLNHNKGSDIYVLQYWVISLPTVYAQAGGRVDFIKTSRMEW